jgi:gliding motility-associated-like protein
LNGCSSNGFPVTVTINPTAFVPTTDTVTICSGNSVDFSLSSNVTSTFNWLAQPNINVFGESTANQTTDIISDLLVNSTALPETVIYNYSATSVANSCQGNLGELLVIVNPTPTADFSLIDYNICENAPVVFTNLTTPASNYYWTFGDGTSSFVTNPTYTYQGINGSFDVELFASNTYGCTDSITKTVTVGAAPPVSFSASVDKACEGQTIIFTDNLNTPNTLLTWDFGDGTNSNNPAFVDHIYNTNGCFDVTLTVADATTGCSATVTENDIVCLYANPTAFFTVDSVIHYTTDPEFEFTNGSLNGYTYVWDFGDGGSSVSTDIVHTYPPTINNYFVTLYTYNEAGCVDSMFMNVSVREELIYFVPNTFTPDLNGVNDLFLPVFTSGFDVNEFSFEVYNRWGNLVFETDNYSKGWDGKLMTGEKAQDGIYTWKIKFRGLLDEYGKYEVGHVTLIR